jgi:hypothetical protein
MTGHSVPSKAYPFADQSSGWARANQVITREYRLMLPRESEHIVFFAGS